jgi:ABC-type nickel/cobalt efflux system permease component RcnA
MTWALPLLIACTATAHPVIGDHHDRTLVVRVAPDRAAGTVVVTVAYRLELNEFTAFRDLQPFSEKVPPGWQKTDPDKYYDGYIACYGPLLARYFEAKGDGKSLQFKLVKSSHTRRDEDGKKLGHVRFDLDFVAAFPLRPGERQTFTLNESEWMEWKGRIDLALAPAGVTVLERTEPSAALKAKSPLDYRPGDFEELRRVALTFEAFPVPALLLEGIDGLQRYAALATRAAREYRGKTGDVPQANEPARPAAGGKTAPAPDDHENLLDLFNSESALWLALLLAAAFGAAHALQPGHGKTLVAAYLVGQRGTVWHAVLLGVVTTMTHTGSVLVLALVLQIFFSGNLSAEMQRDLHKGLGLFAGLLVVGLGFWLLLQRLAGRAEHVHIGGGHHHHHHGGGHHHHHAPAVPPGAKVGLWGLVVLGISGGIVPCGEAVVILLWALARQQVWLAVPLVLAFSAGLAGVLVLIGILVVRVRGFAASRLGEGRLVRALPLVSAVCVFVLGCWLCYASVKGIV